MSFGRTEEEKSKLEEERLMKMFGGSKLQPESKPPVKKQFRELRIFIFTFSRVSLIDQTKLAKVLDAQGYMKQKEPENSTKQERSTSVTSKIQNPVLGDTFFLS